jgi:hypothetical protein
MAFVWWTALALLAAEPAAELLDAQKAYRDVEYTRCRNKAAAALQVPGTRAERVDAHRLLGLCSAALGDTDAGREAFSHMLAIDPDAKLPMGLSPRFTSAYREAKGAWLGAAPLALTLEKEELLPDGGRRVRIRVEDKAALVARITWRAAGDDAPPKKAARLLELEVPATVDVTVVALDAGGGEVAVLLLPATKSPGSALAPDPGATAANEADEDSAWPLVVGVAVGGVVVVGGIAGAVAWALLAPPERVTLRTDVIFGN